MPTLVLVMLSKNPNLEIGAYYRSLGTGPYGEALLRDQPFRVVAMSTEEKYLDCLEAFGHDREQGAAACKVNGPWYYYEIHTD